MAGLTPSQQIDKQIKELGDWRCKPLARRRVMIQVFDSLVPGQICDLLAALLGYPEPPWVHWIGQVGDNVLN